jgi:hypothetical protein
VTAHDWNAKDQGYILSINRNIVTFPCVLSLDTSCLYEIYFQFWAVSGRHNNLIHFTEGYRDIQTLTDPNHKDVEHFNHSTSSIS